MTVNEISDPHKDMYLYNLYAEEFGSINPHLYYGNPSITPPKEIIDHLQIQYLGDFFGMPVWAINGHYVRVHIDVDFTNGGNAARYLYTPKWVIWVEYDYESADQAPSIVHEGIECTLMRKYGLNYGDAHDCANMLEWPFRRSLLHNVDLLSIENPVELAKVWLNTVNQKVYTNFISLVKHFKEHPSEA